MNHTTRVRVLYKSILKLHRGLPVEVQKLGNEYVRDEFKRHKKLDTQKDEQLIRTFMWEWTNYAISLSEQLGLKGIKGEEKLGKNLKEDSLDSFSEEQIVQLHELYIAAKGEKEN